MADYLTVVIRLPDDKENRHLITSALRLGEEFNGGLITGMSLSDELTLNECLSGMLDPASVEKAEEQMRRIHEVASTWASA